MWVRVALDKDSLHVKTPPNYTYIDGDHIEEYYFDDEVRQVLDNDNFLLEMWDNLDALFDWGDCDFFDVEKCVKFRSWLIERLPYCLNDILAQTYEVMLNYANKAIKYGTGICFDF